MGYRAARTRYPAGVTIPFEARGRILACGTCRYLAEAVRFELTNGCPLPVFKTGAIDHSATLPNAILYRASGNPATW